MIVRRRHNGRFAALPNAIWTDERLSIEAMTTTTDRGAGTAHVLVTVAVDDYAGQSVALAPNQAAKSIVYSAPFTIFGRLRDPAFEKIEIKVLLPSREAPRHNLRLGIIDRAADQMIAPILERNNVAVRRFTENLQHFAREYPIVPVENAGPRFDDDSSHALMMSHLCRALHNRLSIFPE